MSRPTDVERGARIAQDIARTKVAQGDLFLSGDERQFWAGIYDAACEQVRECQHAKEAARG